MITFAHSGHDHSAELTQAVADTNGSSAITTADIAYVVCIVSFFVAGSILIYLLLDKIKHNKLAHASKSKVIKPKRTVKASAAKKPTKSSARKTATKRTTKKK